MPIIEQFPVLVVGISLLAAFTILVAGWITKKACFVISAATIFVQFVMSLFILNHVLTVGTIQYWLGGWMPPWGIEYVVDALNAYILVILLFLALLCVLYSKRNIEHELPHKIVPYYAVYQLLITGLCGVTVTGDIFNLYVFVEIFSLAAYALIASRGKIALKASFTYLIMGAIGACFVLLGIGFLYSVTGTLNMHDLSLLLPPLYGNRVVQAAFVFIFVGLGIKMALFPLHTWLPDAHAFAPAEISALLSGIIIEVSTYAFIRITFSVFTLDFVTMYLPITTLISWVAAIAMIYGSVLAIAQYNLKRMLAYSSVANMGYIMLGVGLCTSTTLGLTPAMMHILNHALMKACMFLAAGAFIYKFDLWEITDFRGLGRKMPYTSIAFILAALAMIGMPPSVGFVSKVYLAIACLEAGQFPFIALIFFSTLLMVFYFWRVIEYMYIRVGEEEEKEVEIQEIPRSMLVPVVVLALLCFIMGVIWILGIPFPVMDAINATSGLGVIP
ncbi:MAG TPA: monovalent cation/H+ antiporter subunit D family protein [Methanomicrobia archaeon]|nr:monovalent cation/H+ antiporter subunit D family protein [Methanomicrobia archaeon]